MKTIPFMRYRYFALTASVILMLASIGSFVSKGFNFGLDFTGGTLIEVVYDKPVDIDDIRKQLNASGFDAVVQNFGAETDVMIRLQQSDMKEIATEILSVLRADGSEVKIHRTEFVGPQVGDELKEQGGLGMLIALAAIMFYVTIRFQFKFSVAAVLGLAHTSIITLGFFSYFQWEFDLTVLAALLAMIGYSLNDTISVADRIRENFRLLRKGDSEEIIDISITQTLSRTVVTALTTLFVLFVLLFFGGSKIYGFAMMLIIGIIVGTYASIYVCTSLLLMQGVSKEDLIVQEKEQEEYDTP